MEAQFPENWHHDNNMKIGYGYAYRGVPHNWKFNSKYFSRVETIADYALVQLLRGKTVLRRGGVGQKKGVLQPRHDPNPT